MKKDPLLLGAVGTQVVIAYEWATAGWEKVSNPDFVNGIAGTLAYFASKNPFPWCKDFLLGYATQNAVTFAQAVQWGELAVGAVLAVAGVAYLYAENGDGHRNALISSVIALLGGLAMNATFYFAAGWTGPGTLGLNVVMFWIQAILLFVWIAMLKKMNANA